jgi:hypothetical protein
VLTPSIKLSVVSLSWSSSIQSSSSDVVSLVTSLGWDSSLESSSSCAKKQNYNIMKDREWACHDNIIIKHRLETQLYCKMIDSQKLLSMTVQSHFILMLSVFVFLEYFRRNMKAFHFQSIDQWISDKLMWIINQINLSIKFENWMIFKMRLMKFQ